MLDIFVHPGAGKAMAYFPKKAQSAITRELLALSTCTHPLQHRHVIKLGGAKDRYRMRVGNYRIKMRLRDQNVILITEIEQRQRGY